MTEDLPIAESPLSTEEKIKLAATRIFIREGFAAARTRDIAEAAGINIATLHYYYRTKEELFLLVAREAMSEFSEIFNRVFTQELPLPQKIRRFVAEYTELFFRRRHLAMFCLMESERNVELFAEVMDFAPASRVLDHQLSELAAAGKIRPISTPNFLSALVGTTIYPFITKGTLMRNADMTEADFRAMLDTQKQFVPDMILSYLYPEGEGC